MHGSVPRVGLSAGKATNVRHVWYRAQRYAKDVDQPRAFDRRKRKSRAALQAALVGLIGRKPYADLTIEDVTEAADVARATFYAHYEDKSALLLAATTDLLEEMSEDVAAVAWVGAGTDWRFDGSGLIALLDHVERNRDLYRLVITGGGGPAPRRALIDRLHSTAKGVFGAADQPGREPRQPLHLTVTAFVGALMAILEDQLEQPSPMQPGKLAASFMQHQAGGLEWALGFAPGELRYSAAS
jgi:AcrR family transcriptional regulator